MLVRLVPLALVVTALGALVPAASAQPAPPPGLSIAHTTGRIVIDGDLGDDGWRQATTVTTWYETNISDNTPASVRNVGHLAYDDRFLYVGLEFDDPDPSAIKAPYGDRDNVAFFTDYGGVILDTRHDGRTGVLLAANARGIQYDSVLDDASGNEDPSPDFFWESAAKITERGWTLELRVPFSSLRYKNVDPQTWGIMLYRNYPRDRRYQFFSTTLPRGGNCFVCRTNPLEGLTGLPKGGHLIVAPYASASQTAERPDDTAAALQEGSVKPHAGADVKWTPNAEDAIDFTLNPDFSQVESDTAQITANQRFALFYPEKRPFFLEGVELLATPIQAVYTRTITDPNWGIRATGKHKGIGYTMLVADDAGGGSMVLPGPNGSGLAPVDFSSGVVVGRARRDLGSSFIGALVTLREAGSNGHNRVAGPDFQWRPSQRDVVTGQLLFSQTETPNRQDVTPEWDGSSFSSHAANMSWSHNTTHLDAFASYIDIGDGFRADTGFVPQVGVREVNAQSGYTVHPSGFLSRMRFFLIADHQSDRTGALISREVSPGTGMDGRWNSFFRFRYADDRVRSGDNVFPRQQFIYIAQMSPPHVVSRLSIDGYAGTDIDFDNSRPGRGNAVNLSATINPTKHLELILLENRQWLNVDDVSGRDQRLFTATVTRVRSTYTFTARSFLRLIGQYSSTDRDPALYLYPVTPKSGDFSGSALFAYKLNWQSVLFLGYGDDRALDERSHLQQMGRQLFVKMSYAFQR